MSLICKAVSISYGGAAINYAENRTLKDGYDIHKGKYMVDTGISIAEEFDRNALKGVTAEECWHEMEVWKRQSGHSNIKRGCLWLTIAPSKDLCDKLDNDDLEYNGKKIGWHEIYEDFLRQMELTNTMRLAVMHDRTERQAKGRKHIHVAVNRIDLDGNVIKDKMIWLKAKNAADKISEKYGLETARNIGKKRKAEIKKIAFDVLARLPKFSLEDYSDALAKKGIKLETYADKNGNIKGYRLFWSDGGFKFKASEIDRNLTLSSIETSYYLLHKTYKDEKHYADNYKKMLQDAGIKRVRQFKDGNTRHSYIQVSIKENPSKNEKDWSKPIALDKKELRGLKNKTLTKEEIAAKHFTKALQKGGEGGHAGKREWEIANYGRWDDVDDEQSMKQRNGISM